MIEILCDDFIGCKEAGNNDDYHIQKQITRTFNMSVTWMRICFDHLQQAGTFFALSCINLKPSFLFVDPYLVYSEPL